MLHLEFAPSLNNNPFVNGIEIVPSQPGAIRPIRILARDSAFTDEKNRLWSADRYSTGECWCSGTIQWPARTTKSSTRTSASAIFLTSFPWPWGTLRRDFEVLPRTGSAPIAPAPAAPGPACLTSLFQWTLVAGQLRCIQAGRKPPRPGQDVQGPGAERAGQLIFTFTPSTITPW